VTDSAIVNRLDRADPGGMWGDDRETTTLEKTLNKLQCELQDLTQNTDMEMESISKDMQATIDKSTSDFTAKKADLQTQINTVVPEMAKTTEENKQVCSRMILIMDGRGVSCGADVKPNSCD